MGDEWANAAEAYYSVSSKLSEHMASKALERHSSLWEEVPDTAKDFEREIQFLDIAAGPGWFSKLLAARLREEGRSFPIHCTEFSPSMVTLARRNITDPEVRIYVMVGQDLSRFEDASLDGVNCLFGIMFMPEYPTSFDEMKRVLKLGAKVTVGTWHTAGVLDLADAFGLYLGSLSPGEVSEGRRTLALGQDPANLDKLLLEAGFSDIIVQQEEYSLGIDNLEAMYELLVRKPASTNSLMSPRHGITKPSLEIFKEFMTGSLAAAPFRQSGNSGTNYVTRFVANMGVGSA